jgi:hypothetical protein
MIPFSAYPVELSVVVKTQASAERMAAPIKAAVDASHGGRAAFNIRAMDSYVSDSTGDTRFILFVLAAFAVASVLLAMVGLYGTLAYLTAQRTPRIRDPAVSGSTLEALVAIVIRESVLLAVAGAAVGLAGATAAMRAIRGLLYGVRPLEMRDIVRRHRVCRGYRAGSRGCAGMACYADRSADFAKERVGIPSGIVVG